MFRRMLSPKHIEDALTPSKPQRFLAAQNDLLPEPGSEIDRGRPPDEERRQEGRDAPAFHRIDDIEPLDARIDAFIMHPEQRPLPVGETRQLPQGATALAQALQIRLRVM